jgi:hypothetical protein
MQLSCRGSSPLQPATDAADSTAAPYSYHPDIKPVSPSQFPEVRKFAADAVHLVHLYLLMQRRLRDILLTVIAETYALSIFIERGRVQRRE